jgi:signal transduction histidine kinase
MWWIKQTTLENRLHLMKYLADETADRIVQQNGNLGYAPFFHRMLDERFKLLRLNEKPVVLIADMNGVVLFSNIPRIPRDNEGFLTQGYERISAEILENDLSIQKLQLQDKFDVYLVKSPIHDGEDQLGWVVVLQSADVLTDVHQEYRLLVIMLLGLALLGWIVIYFLSKKISKPIQEVAKAAMQIQEGNYDIKLNNSATEEEINNLISSFKEMTQRLMQLEKLRAELLAGVTHDLKTPVTSISGLLQAVRDGVVSGDESKEFLDIALKEVYRLQTMIADLLDYNTLSAGAVTIRLENCNMNQLIQEIVRQWAVTQDNHFQYEVIVPETTIYHMTDPLRLQQIMINLLNNAKQALESDGKITVILNEDSIDVKDTGSGIPEDEQPYVFERFFRGKKKKLKVRGLGLGLPFSKMLAKALHADLILKESSPQGTTFSILFKKQEDGKA